MKKSLIAFCGAALAVAAFAQEPAVSAEAKADAPAKAERGPRAVRNRPQPTMLLIDAKTTPEQVEAYKKEAAEKIDAAYAAFKTKKAEEGKEKAPTRVMLMVMDRPFGGPGMGQGMGPGMNGRRGPRGNRPGRPEGAPAAEAK